MSNVEKIDAYLGNEMTEANRQVFEESIKNDPILKKEFQFQQEITSAIKDTRKLELKAMLDKVPVGGGSSSGMASIGKIISGIAVVGAVGLGIYLLQDDDASVKPDNSQIGVNKEVNKPIEKQETITPLQKDEEVIQPEEQTVTANDSETNTDVPGNSMSDINSNTAKDEDKGITPESNKELEPENQTDQTERAITKPEINKPEISSFGNQENEYDSLEAPGGNMLNKDYNGQAGVDVEIEPSSKKYNFHYQFKDNRLVLYGDFDLGLYEILEINSDDGKLLFLYYKDKFYSLNRDQTKIASLEAIGDLSLIEKLKKVRSEG